MDAGAEPLPRVPCVQGRHRAGQGTFPAGPQSCYVSDLARLPLRPGAHQRRLAACRWCQYTGAGARTRTRGRKVQAPAKNDAEDEASVPRRPAGQRVEPVQVRVLCVFNCCCPAVSGGDRGSPGTWKLMPLGVRAADAADTAWQRQPAAWPGNNTHAVWPAARARRAHSSSLVLRRFSFATSCAWQPGLYVCSRGLNVYYAGFVQARVGFLSP